MNVLRKARSSVLIGKPFGTLQMLGVVFLAITAFAITALAQQYYQWSSWMGTNASGIEYRYEITGPYVVMVQFQNKTDGAVTIDYAAWVPGQDKAQKGTTPINSKSTSGNNNISTTNGQPPSRVDVQVK
jgi:hypothetical protein